MKTLTFAALALACAAPAHAATFQPDTTVLGDDIHYDVRPDGSFTMDEVEVLRINSDQGVKLRSQLALPYSASLQDMEVVEAYTTTRDGRRIDVAPDKILVQQSPQSAGAPMFDDGKVKVVVFPAVEVGATVSAHIRKVQKTPLFPGQFSMSEVAWSNLEIKSETVTVDAPAAMHLLAQAVDMVGGVAAAPAPGRQRWRWTIADTVARAPEAAAVAASDDSPRVALTTFADYEAAGRAYLDRAGPKAAVTADIQRLADQITAGIPDRRAQAEAIYRWVSQNIRYVAIFLDFGGVVPHDAPSIAEARYGDCKDHAALLQALLAAKGIQGYPALVNGQAAYVLPAVAVLPGVFDHAITYLPEFHLFVDSTASLAMFGTLPLTEYGKQALVTDDGTGHPRLMRLPLASAQADRVDIRTRLVVAPDGTVDGTSEVSNTGAFDWLARLVFSGVPPGMEAQAVSKVLARSGQGGTGSFTTDGLHDLSRPFAYATSFKLPGYVPLPGPGAMTLPDGFTSLSNIAAALEMFGPERRESAFAAASRQVSESITLQLPAGLAIASLPRAVTLDTPLGQYRSSYVANGAVVTVTRSLVLTLPGATENVQDYQVLRSLALGIHRDLRAQILFD